MLQRIEAISYQLSPDALVIDPLTLHDAPIEEFRALRTRLNHLQKRQPIHTVVITSASPAEGKSFSAVNLALAQAQLSGNLTLLCDFDLRRPVIHKLFQIDRGPGLNRLPGRQSAARTSTPANRRYESLCHARRRSRNQPARTSKSSRAKRLLDRLPGIFNWVILDSPPLLFAADGNLLATLSDGAILVVRIGATSSDSIARAMQSLCENNVIGIIVNGARRGELYSKYTYYHSYK